MQMLLSVNCGLDLQADLIQPEIWSLNCLTLVCLGFVRSGVSLCFWVHCVKACVESLASSNYNANKDGCFSSTQTKGLFLLSECLFRTECLFRGSVEVRLKCSIKKTIGIPVQHFNIPFICVNLAIKYMTLDLLGKSKAIYVIYILTSFLCLKWFKRSLFMRVWRKFCQQQTTLLKFERV